MYALFHPPTLSAILLIEGFEYKLVFLRSLNCLRPASTQYFVELLSTADFLAWILIFIKPPSLRLSLTRLRLFRCPFHTTTPKVLKFQSWTSSKPPSQQPSFFTSSSIAMPSIRMTRNLSLTVLTGIFGSLDQPQHILSKRRLPISGGSVPQTKNCSRQVWHTLES